MFENALDPIVCMTGTGQESTLAAYVSLWLCMATGVLHWVIAWRLWVVFDNKTVAVTLIAIFVLGSVCGYLYIPLAYWIGPNVAYSLRLLNLVVHQFACVIFVWATFGKTFNVYHSASTVGQQVIDAAEIHRFEVDELLDHAIDFARNHHRRNT